MKTLTLLDNFYKHSGDFDENYLSRALLQLIIERTKQYDVEFEYAGLHQPGDRPIIAMSGKDEEFVYNYLVRDFGTVRDFDDLTVGDVIRGRMRDPEKVNFGVFIDCGIENPVKDVLLPAYNLRKQVIDGDKATKREICYTYGFFEHFPIYVKITEIDNRKKEITCELADETLDMYDIWIDDGFEILFSTGMPRKQIKKAIKRTGHYQDYVTIDRLGFLETLTFLKLGTHAPGILADIGPLLSSVRFSMLRPSKVRHLLRSK